MNARLEWYKHKVAQHGQEEASQLLKVRERQSWQRIMKKHTDQRQQLSKQDGHTRFACTAGKWPIVGLSLYSCGLVRLFMDMQYDQYHMTDIRIGVNLTPKDVIWGDKCDMFVWLSIDDMAN